MTTPKESQQADDLYKSLHQKTRLDDPNLPEETILGKDPQSIASTVQPSARFQASLERELDNLACAGAAEFRKGKPSQSPGNLSNRPVGEKLRSIFPTLAWGVVIFLVFAGLAWAMRSLLPN